MTFVNICLKKFAVDETALSRKHELVRELFVAACRAKASDEGILMLASKDSRILGAYNFKSGMELDAQWFAKDDNASMFESQIYLPAFEGHVMRLADNAIYTLYMISDKKCDLTSVSQIADIIRNSYAAAKKYAYRGDLLLDALDCADEAVSYASADGKLRYMNKYGLEVMGATAEELYDKPVAETVSDNAMLLQILKRRKHILDREYSIYYKGKLCTFINSGYLVTDQNGTATGAIDIYKSIERNRKIVGDMAGFKALKTFDDILFSCNEMRETVDAAKLFANSDETILILGESGVGKDIFAQAIHNSSDRAGGPFIALNCANFSSELMDSELFGYEAGAFTGANKGGKTGKFALADGGTIFLDEIGEMSFALQAKLLRVLETLTITKVGGNKPQKIDVRIIAATNRDLQECIEEKTFRQDLFYRLKVLSIEVPPLRERHGDIGLLARAFLNRAAHKAGKDFVNITQDAIAAMEAYDWPGNIRELENLASRLVYMCDGNTIDRALIEKVGITKITNAFVPPSHKNISEITREQLYRIYSEKKGNKKKTAEELGISRPTLYKLLREFEII